jgi:hypothetical protein
MAYTSDYFVVNQDALYIASNPIFYEDNNFSSVVAKIPYCLSTKENVTPQHGTS